MANAPIQAVFNTAELRDSILARLDGRSLVRVQRVSKRFHLSVTDTKSLQSKRFMPSKEEDDQRASGESGHEIMVEPALHHAYTLNKPVKPVELNDMLVIPFLDHSAKRKAGLKLNGRVVIINPCLDLSTIDVAHSSCAGQYISRPPCVRMSITWARHIADHNDDYQESEYPGTDYLYEPAGLRFCDILDSFDRFGGYEYMVDVGASRLLVN